MITISIIVDGRLHAILRVFDTGTVTPDGRTVYRTPDGTRIEHDPDEGVWALARKMLDTSGAAGGRVGT